MVVISLEKYSKLMNELAIERNLYAKFGNANIEDLLDESELQIADNCTEYLTHQEVFSKIKGRINEGK